MWVICSSPCNPPCQVLCLSRAFPCSSSMLPQVSLDAGERGGRMADVCVSGLPGWVAVHVPEAIGLVQLRIWAPAGIEVFVRPQLPAPW